MKWRRIFKSIFDGIFLIGTVLLILLSLAGYFGLFNRYLELTSHFKLQYLIVSFCPFFFFLLRRHNLGFSISLFCLLINLYEIAPWYLPSSWGIANNSEAQQIRVFQSNVDKYSNNYDRVISLARKEKPDLAVFLEVGKTGAKKLEVLKDILPYSIAHQDVKIDGAAIYSKLPLLNTSIKSLGGGRKSILADVLIQKKLISVIAVHPSQALGKIYFEERNRQLVGIADYVAKVKNPLVVGDFNVTMWSPYYKRFVSTAKLRNARKGFGILPSWHTSYPLLSIPIDHCFVRDNIKVLKIRIGRNVGSDHLPVITDLLIPTKSS
jgi:endonuclease/exonuclease/phosphatase (EEP) superfamily protein YafD